MCTLVALAFDVSKTEDVDSIFCFPRTALTSLWSGRSTRLGYTFFLFPNVCWSQISTGGD